MHRGRSSCSARNRTGGTAIPVPNVPAWRSAGSLPWGYSGSQIALPTAQVSMALGMAKLYVIGPRMWTLTNQPRIPRGRVRRDAQWNDSERRGAAPCEHADRVCACAAPQTSRLNGLAAHLRATTPHSRELPKKIRLPRSQCASKKTVARKSYVEYSMMIKCCL
jgi:hypothetical protein